MVWRCRGCPVILIPSRHAWRNRPGQSLVEFVLIAPLLFLLIFGLIEFARAWNIRHVVTDAAREAARFTVVSTHALESSQMTEAQQADSAMSLIATALRSAGLSPDQATITIDNGGGMREQPSRVSITYPYKLRVVRTFLGWAVEDGTINIGTTFVMRNE
jgi:Flp pilus assembly protein TadG